MDKTKYDTPRRSSRQRKSVSALELLGIKTLKPKAVPTDSRSSIPKPNSQTEGVCQTVDDHSKESLQEECSTTTRLKTCPKSNWSLAVKNKKIPKPEVVIEVEVVEPEDGPEIYLDEVSGELVSTLTQNQHYQTPAVAVDQLCLQPRIIIQPLKQEELQAALSSYVKVENIADYTTQLASDVLKKSTCSSSIVKEIVVETLDHIDVKESQDINIQEQDECVAVENDQKVDLVLSDPVPEKALITQLDVVSPMPDENATSVLCGMEMVCESAQEGAEDSSTQRQEEGQLTYDALVKLATEIMNHEDHSQDHGPGQVVYRMEMAGGEVAHWVIERPLQPGADIQLRPATTEDIDIQFADEPADVASDTEADTEAEMAPVTSQELQEQPVSKETGRAKPQKQIIMSQELKAMVDQLKPSDDVENHLVITKNDQGKKVKMECAHCMKPINDRHEFRKHMRTHKDVAYKPYACPICGYKSQIKAGIARHINIHSKVKPYVCMECGRGFNFKQKLQLHLKYHRDIRDQECPVCKSAFHEWKTLRNHMARVHGSNHPQVHAFLLKRQECRPKEMAKHAASQIVRGSIFQRLIVTKPPEKSEVEKALKAGTPTELQQALAALATDTAKPTTIGAAHSSDLIPDKDGRVYQESDSSIRASSTKDVIGKIKDLEKGYMNDGKPTIIVTGTAGDNVQQQVTKSVTNFMYIDKRESKPKEQDEGLFRTKGRMYGCLKTMLHTKQFKDGLIPLGASHDQIHSSSSGKSQSQQGVQQGIIVDTSDTHVKHIQNVIQEVPVEELSMDCAVEVVPVEHVEEFLIEQDVQVVEELPAEREELPAVEEVPVKGEELPAEVELPATMELSAAEVELSTVVELPPGKEVTEASEDGPGPDADQECPQDEVSVHQVVPVEVIEDTNCLAPKEDTKPPTYNRARKAEELNPGMVDLCSLLESDGGKQVFFCNLCSETCTSKTSFSKHVEIHHPNMKAWKCDECSYSCRLRSSLFIHQKSVHQGVKNHTCAQCDKSFPTRAKLVIHEKTHTDRFDCACDQCDRKFREPGDLRRHVYRVHTTEYKYTCDQCGKEFKDNTQLGRHLETHVVGKPLTCQYCKKNYKSRSSLAQHMKSHTCMFHCEICDKNFGSYSGFMAHKVMHDESYEGFTCNLCSKVLHTKGSLHRHLKIAHTTDRPFCCNTCTKAFKSKKDLKNHQLVHGAVKTYTCEVCHFTCKRLDTLRVHRRRHQSSKPYQCNVCGKEYTQKYSLDVHLRYHSGHMEGECVICNKLFATKYQLEQHIRRRHAGDTVTQEDKMTVFVCEECDAAFVSQDTLAVHILAQHMNQGFVGQAKISEGAQDSQGDVDCLLLAAQVGPGDGLAIVGQQVEIGSSDAKTPTETLVTVSDPSTNTDRLVSIIAPQHSNLKTETQNVDLNLSVIGDISHKKDVKEDSMVTEEMPMETDMVPLSPMRQFPEQPANLQELLGSGDGQAGADYVVSSQGDLLPMMGLLSGGAGDAGGLDSQLHSHPQGEDFSSTGDNSVEDAPAMSI